MESAISKDAITLAKKNDRAVLAQQAAAYVTGPWAGMLLFVTLGAVQRFREK